LSIRPAADRQPVTNGDLEPGDHPDAWKIFRVNVGETGLPPNRPRVSVN